MRKIIFVFVGLVFALSIFKFFYSSNNNFCANSISCIKNLSADIENNSTGTFEGQKVTPPTIDLVADASRPKVLGDSTATGVKHIYVDLTHQTLYAYQGNTLYMQAFISSGKWHATPTGDFKIWIKLRATRMTGGEGADFYDLPNVPFTMFFAGANAPAGAGFSLHGAYWHDNFGHAMSHGCVNMRTIDAQKLFDWADPVTTGPTTTTDATHEGTAITIYGQAPL